MADEWWCPIRLPTVVGIYLNQTGKRGVNGKYAFVFPPVYVVDIDLTGKVNGPRHEERIVGGRFPWIVFRQFR